MQLSDILGFLFGVATIIGGTYAVLTYRQQSPKRRVTLSTEETQLLSAQASEFREMNIYHASREVKDPRFVDVAVQATGRADVPSARFDDSRPLVLDCGRPILAYMGNDAVSVLVLDQQRLAIGPMLLKEGVPTKIRLLIDGPSACEWEDPKLIDTKVQIVSGTAAARLESQRSHKQTATVFPALLITILSLAFATQLLVQYYR